MFKVKAPYEPDSNRRTGIRDPLLYHLSYQPGCCGCLYQPRRCLAAFYATLDRPLSKNDCCMRLSADTVIIQGKRLRITEKKMRTLIPGTEKGPDFFSPVPIDSISRVIPGSVPHWAVTFSVRSSSACSGAPDPERSRTRRRRPRTGSGTRGPRSRSRRCSVRSC